MPRIPTYERSVLPPGVSSGVAVSPEAVTAPSRAFSQFGSDLSQTASYAGRVAGALEEKERTAANATYLLELKNKVRAGLEASAEALANQGDYRKLDDFAEEQIRQLETSTAPDDNASPEVMRAYQEYLGQATSNLRGTIRAKKYNLIEQVGKAEFGNYLQDATNRWSTADPAGDERAAIEKEIRDTGKDYANSGAVDPLWIESAIDRFKTNAQTAAANTADVLADQAIERNPIVAAKALRDESLFTDLTPKQRQDKIEKADRVADTAIKEAKQKEEAAVKAAHDAEERRIGDLYMSGDMTKTYAAALASKILTGDEKRTWDNAIKARLNTPSETRKKNSVISLVRINDMMSRGEDPAVIRDAIVKDPNFEIEEKKNLLNRLEAKLTADEREGTKRGYDLIRKTIIPARSLMDPVRETSLEIAAAANAQQALDEWVASRKAAGKPPTEAEVITQARTYAYQYQVPMVDAVRALEQGMRDRAAQMKAYSEAKVAYEGIPEDQRLAIEQSLRDRGMPSDVEAVVNAYRGAGQ